MEKIFIFCKLSFEIFIPQNFLWCFMEKFKSVFDGKMDIGYKNGCHISVTIPQKDKERFFVFLRDFCQEKGLASPEEKQEE